MGQSIGVYLPCRKSRSRCDDSQEEQSSEFIGLPMVVHRRIHQYISTFDPKSRFRFARSCRFLWKMTIAATNTLSPYSVVNSESNQGIDIYYDEWPGGPRAMVTIDSPRTMVLLLSGNTVLKVELSGNVTYRIPRGLRTYELSMFMVSQIVVPGLLEIMKPVNHKYRLLQFRSDEPEVTPDMIGFFRQNARAVVIRGSVDRTLWGPLADQIFRVPRDRLRVA